MNFALYRLKNQLLILGPAEFENLCPYGVLNSAYGKRFKDFTNFVSLTPNGEVIFVKDGITPISGVNSVSGSRSPREFTANSVEEIIDCIKDFFSKNGILRGDISAWMLKDTTKALLAVYFKDEQPVDSDPIIKELLKGCIAEPEEPKEE